MHNRILDELMAATNLRDADNEPADGTGDGGEVTEIARQQLQQSRRVVEQFVSSHPAICLGLAAGVGIALGWWVKRK